MNELIKNLIQDRMKDFSARQKFLLEELEKVGYGYAEFSKSVSKQGFCSKKQEETMEGMLLRIKSRETNNENNNGIGYDKYRHTPYPNYYLKLDNGQDNPIYEDGKKTGYYFGGPSGGYFFYDENGEETCPPDNWREKEIGNE